MKFFDVFKAGNYPQGVFSTDDVEALAKNYDPKFCEAPITLDHEQRGPAYGWVSELKAENGRLKASFRDVTDELKEFVQSGKYKKISVEIYKELEGKRPYLKAVSFLGAGIPQVKGMEPVRFKEGETQIYIFELEEPARTQKPEVKTEPKPEFETLQEIIRLQNQISEIQDRVAHMIDKPEKDDSLIVAHQEKVVNLSAQIKKLEESETKRQKTEQELSELKQKLRNDEFEEFLNEQIDEGRINAAHKEPGLKILTALDNVKQFADCSQRLQGGLGPTGTPFNASNQADESDYVEKFKEFVAELPKREMSRDFATKDKRSSADGEYLNFANASEESLAIYKEVKHLAEKENISFKDALLRLYK